MTNATNHALTAYFTSLRSALAVGDATEHTYRPALKQLIDSCGPGVVATNEPKGAERENKPDYIIRKNSTIVGFVEAKDIDKELSVAAKTAQIKRYLDALPNLILTNYRDFV